MNIPRLQLPSLAAIALCALAGCASTPDPEVLRRAADVKVFDIDQTVRPPYEVVRRLWVASQRAAMTLPTHASRNDAIASLRVEAARLDADALVNVNCLDQAAGTQGGAPAILCYGIAVRLGKG